LYFTEPYGDIDDSDAMGKYKVKAQSEEFTVPAGIEIAQTPGTASQVSDLKSLATSPDRRCQRQQHQF